MMMAAGLALVLAGGLLWLFGGRLESRGGLLPGDISIRRPGFSFHFPIVTCIVASLLLTLIGRLLRR
jgi:Protein of unknown function (DUF2905)